MTPSNQPPAPAVRIRHPRHAAGVVLVLAAGVLLSLSGVSIRHMEAASGWQIIFYRSLAFSLVVFLWLASSYRTHVVRAFARVGRAGLIAGLSLGLGSACYVFALLLTTVANALFIISAAPFMAAVLGWIVLRERVRPTTWATMAVALAGIAIMVFGGIRGGRLLGNLVALGIPVTFAIMLVALRRGSDRDMLPAICLAGVVGAVLGLAMSDTLAIPRHDLALCIFLGVVQYGGGFVLLTLGARYLPAAEVALLSLVETVLAPLWVWIGVDEVPTLLTLTGGVVVLLAVVVQTLAGMRLPAGSRG